MGAQLIKFLTMSCSVLLVFSIMLPAYAEVTSLKTNTSFYKGGSKIYFSGSTLPTDERYINVVIENPNGGFVMIASGLSNSTHQFEVMVDTSLQENQNKFTIKGFYNATAFIANKTAGKSTSFVFSPDGSPVASSPPTGLVSTFHSSTEIDLRWSVPTNTGGAAITGYKIERNNGNGFVDLKNIQATNYQDTGLFPNTQYSYRVSAINPGGTSNPSNVVSVLTLFVPNNTGSTPSPTQNTTGSQGQTSPIDDLIQQRIENAKKAQQLLQEKSKEISLNENLNLKVVSGNASSSKTTLENKVPPFDFNNVLYPLIALAGVVVIVVVLYLKKNRLWLSRKSTNVHEPDDTMGSDEKDNEPLEEDYSIMILKNRLAKGEITIEEFTRLKDALKEF